MFPPGHYGVALLLYAIVGYGLLARGYDRDALYGTGVVLAYALLPDLDGNLAVFVHRGVTHTLWFALGAGALSVVIVASSLWRRPRGEALRGACWAFFLGAFAVVAHLLADLLNPWGVMPVYPVSPRLFTLDLVYADNAAANYALLALGCGVAALAWTAGRSARPVRERALDFAVGTYRRVAGSDADGDRLPK